MERGILVINAGSSSIKFAVYRADDDDEPGLEGRGQIEGLGGEPRFIARDATGQTLDEKRWPGSEGPEHRDATRFLIDWLAAEMTAVEIVACGHRVGHGGVRYTRPTRIDDSVIADLETLTPLAPLHQPHNLAAMRAIAESQPTLPQVACFDTSFHRTQPRVAQRFAIPRAMTESGVLRYGFHGISYEYIARRLPMFAPQAKRVVVAHLGNGASMCALLDGHSIDSSMGFTAVDGLPMGTRTGAIDPGLLLYLMQSQGYDAAAIENFLYRESGLLGMSGISNDMRALLASDAAEAAEAIEVFCYAIGKFLGALAMALGGLDAIVFTAGIGEHAPRIRANVCRQAGWLGLRLDPAANEVHGPRISTDDSPISAWVIPTNEEVMIALHTQAVLARDEAL